MNYSQAKAYLDSFINYAGAGKGREFPRRMKKLFRIEALLEAFDNPEKKVPVVLVAGTKGKGSTCGMLASICRCAGYSTGVYSSPHIMTVRERIVVNGRNISRKEFAALITRMAPVLNRYEDRQGLETPSYFEIMTVAAFLYFLDQKADIAIVEVGMGGKLDATNSADPIVSIITSIGLEHTEYLGPDLQSIAGEKSGIMRSKRPVIVTVQKQEALKRIKTEAKLLHARLIQKDKAFTINEVASGKYTFRQDGTIINKISIPLPGSHQVTNCSGAIAAALQLRNYGFPQINEHVIKMGVRKTKISGRIDIIGNTILDASHTEESVKELRSVLLEQFPDRPVYALFNLSTDKDLDKIVAVLPENIVRLTVVPTDNPRTYRPEDLCDELDKRNCIAEVGEDAVAEYKDALLEAADNNGVVLVFGTFFLLNHIYRSINNYS